jgi:hypothetical protein
LIKSTKNQLKDFLQSINKLDESEFSLIMVYKWFILKELAIYNALNCMKFDQKLLIGLMWCPLKFRPILDQRIMDIRQKRNIDGP